MIEINPVDNQQEIFRATLHDLKVPLFSIIGFTDLVEKNLEDKELILEYVRKIKLSSNQMLKLVDRNLNREDNNEIRNKEGNIKNLLSSIVSSFKILLNQKKLKVENNFNTLRSEKIIFDEVKIFRIFNNILSNAIKYSNEKCVINIDVYRERESNRYIEYLIVVSDNGIGMDEKFLDLIYKPYTRENNLNASGHGLGMWITKKLVEQMNGKIEIESKKNVGTKVFIHLKFEKANASQTVNSKVLENKNVMIVEDDDFNRDLIKEILKQKHINVYEEKNGLEALETLKQNKVKFDFIILDVNMDGINGYETSLKIRDIVNNDLLKIIIMSGETRKKDLSEYKVDGFIEKPINFNKLFEMMEMNYTNS